jgi:hypothetical protein
VSEQSATPLLEDVGGRYFFDCNETAGVNGRTEDVSGAAAYALDPAKGVFSPSAPKV